MANDGTSKRAGIRVANSTDVKIDDNTIEGKFDDAISVEGGGRIQITRNKIAEKLSVVPDEELLEKTIAEIKRSANADGKVTKGVALQISKSTGLWELLAKVSDVATVTTTLVAAFSAANLITPAM